LAVADVLFVPAPGVIGAELDVRRGEWFEAAASGFGVVLTAGVGCGHGMILCIFEFVTASSRADFPEGKFLN
jgi:hypothetical protein